jgi:hypothetical protein
MRNSSSNKRLDPLPEAIKAAQAKAMTPISPEAFGHRIQDPHTITVRVTEGLWIYIYWRLIGVCHNQSGGKPKRKDKNVQSLTTASAH